MIWHVQAADFVRYLETQGFVRIGRTERHDIYERWSVRIQVRRASTLTQAEVDAVCDAADLNPPSFNSFFGD